MKKHPDTAGWESMYDVKNQCGICKHAIVERKMAACEYNKQGFPAAHNCPIFKFDEELVDG
jgi:hypothetical protein